MDDNNDIFSFEDFLNNRANSPKPKAKKVEPIKEDILPKVDEAPSIAEQPKQEIELIQEDVVVEIPKPIITPKEVVKPVEVIKPKEIITEKPVQHYTHTFSEQIGNEDSLEKIDEDGYYNIYKDRSEIFTCEIDVDGTSPENVEARLVIEGKDYSLMFPGELVDGICSIPIKKLAILEEGQVGKIRLEVIVEGKMFSPWENDFKVKALKKKISVDVKVNVKKIL